MRRRMLAAVMSVIAFVSRERAFHLAIRVRRHFLTRRDVLEQNQDLLAHAPEVLLAD
jgi:hypothetical protein